MHLNGAGIPCLLFKGGADYAEGLAPATRRIMGDVDVLVHPDDVVRATEVLCEAGWRSSSGESLRIFACWLQFVRAPTSAQDGTATSICIGWCSTFPSGMPNLMRRFGAVRAPPVQGQESSCAER